jgi:MprA protease rhombosortase-interaction domain-containing protein
MRKQLLIAESELNRAQLSDEWRKLTAVISDLTHRTKTTAVWSSCAAMLMAGLAGFRRRRVMAGGERPSWLQRTLVWGQLAGSFWRAFRRRKDVAAEGHT